MSPRALEIAAPLAFGGSSFATACRIAPMRFSFALACLLVGTLARADTLTDLKAILTSSATREPLRVAVTFETLRHQADEAAGEPGKVTARVQDGPEGLQITWPREVVDAAAAEESARGKDRNLRTKIRPAMDGLSATALTHYLDTAPTLLQQLGQAELLEEKSVAWQGQPARLLTFKVTPPMSEKDKKYIKTLEVTAKLWLGADGWPLAAEQSMNLKGRAFLVITFEQHERQELRYTRVGSRLVTVYHLKESENSGGGEHGKSRSLATLTLEKS